MSTTPKLSIVIPVYNTEKYLHKCIDSVLAQTFTDYELILVDDGSKDSSPAICDEYAAKDSRIRVIHQENAGACLARKAGIAIAVGDYIGFVDSDDYIEPDMYETLYDKAISNNADIVACNFFEDGGFITEVKLGLGEGLYDSDSIKKNLFFNLEIGKDTVNEILVNKIFRGNLIKECMGKNEFSLRIYEDCVMAAYCMLECKLLYVVNRALYHYNKNVPQSLTHRRGGERLIQLGYFCQEVEKMRSHPEFTEDVAFQFELLLTQSIMNEINFGLGFGTHDLLSLDPYYLDEIPQWSRIVLCGTNSRNNCYKRQIEARGDHTVVECYDFLSKLNPEYDSLSEEDYDYCVITIGNPPIVEYIAQCLEKMNVPRERILNFEQKKCIFRFLKENNLN